MFALRHIPIGHWIVTFHDDTLEVIALRGSVTGQTDLSPEKAVGLHEAIQRRSYTAIHSENPV